MDYSQLSDEELDKRLLEAERKASKKPASIKTLDYDSMSDEELDERLRQLEKPRAFVQEERPRDSTTAGEAFFEGTGQGATLGYLPNLQAMAEPITDRIGNLFVENEVEPAPWRQMVAQGPEYIEARDRNIERHDRQFEEHPAASIAGQIGGIAATSMVPASLIAKSAQGAANVGRIARVGQVAKGAGVAAAEAALVNPGSTKGEFNPWQISERLDNAKLGAMFGAGGVVGSRMAQKGLKSAKEMSQKIAFKSSGAMLKDFRNASSRGKVGQLGDFLLDKILEVGDTFEDVVDKSKALRARAGQEIGEIYRDVVDRIGTPSFWNKLDPAKKSALSMSGFRPAAQKGEILQNISESIGDSPNRRTALSYIQGYMDDLIEKYGDDLDIVTANKIKGSIDDSINYGRRAQDLPEKQEALFALRNYIRDRVEEHIGVLDDIIDTKQVQKLKDANKLFGNASEIENIAFDRVQRESANRFFSLGDRLVGAAGMGGGAASGAIMGGDLESTLKGAAVGSLGAMGSRIARRYGPGVAAKTLSKTSKQTGLAKAPSMVASGLNKTLTENEEPENKPRLKRNNPIRRVKGREKWANDGLKKLIESEKGNKSKTIQKNKEALLKSKKGRDLLIEASNLSPNSKRMKSILAKIEKEYGGKK